MLVCSRLCSPGGGDHGNRAAADSDRARTPRSSPRARCSESAGAGHGEMAGAGQGAMAGAGHSAMAGRDGRRRSAWRRGRPDLDGGGQSAAARGGAGRVGPVSGETAACPPWRPSPEPVCVLRRTGWTLSNPRGKRKRTSLATTRRWPAGPHGVAGPAEPVAPSSPALGPGIRAVCRRLAARLAARRRLRVRPWLCPPHPCRIPPTAHGLRRAAPRQPQTVALTTPGSHAP